MERCELSPTTVVRFSAHQLKRKRFFAAYGARQVTAQRLALGQLRGDIGPMSLRRPQPCLACCGHARQLQLVFFLHLGHSTNTPACLWSNRCAACAGLQRPSFPRGYAISLPLRNRPTARIPIIALVRREPTHRTNTRRRITSTNTNDTVLSVAIRMGCHSGR